MMRIQALKEEFTPSAKSELEQLVATAKMEDRMFFKTGIEDEDFEEAFMFYMKDDMELQMEMQQIMMNIQNEMGGAHGGGHSHGGCCSSC